MKLVYNKINGEILRVLPDDQDVLTFFYHFPKEIKDNIEYMQIKNIPKNLKHYFISNGILKRRTTQEITEIQQYGRILTEEERLLKKLKPSPEEVRKAEQTIEILTLIQEVI